MAAEGYLDCVLRESGNIPPDLDDPPDGGGDSGGDGGPGGPGDECKKIRLWQCTQEGSDFADQCEAPCVQTEELDVTAFGNCITDCDTTSIGDNECCGGQGTGCKECGGNYFSTFEDCMNSCPCDDVLCNIYECPLEGGDPAEQDCTGGPYLSLSSHTCDVANKNKCYLSQPINNNECQDADQIEDCVTCEGDIVGGANDPFKDQYRESQQCKDCEDDCNLEVEPSCTTYICEKEQEDCGAETINCTAYIIPESVGVADCFPTNDKGDEIGGGLTCYDYCVDDAKNTLWYHRQPDNESKIFESHKEQANCENPEEGEFCVKTLNPCTVYSCPVTGSKPCGWTPVGPDPNVDYVSSGTETSCCSAMEVTNLDTPCCDCNGTYDVDNPDCFRIPLNNNSLYGYADIFKCLDNCTDPCPNKWLCPNVTGTEGDQDCEQTCTGANVEKTDRIEGDVSSVVCLSTEYSTDNGDAVCYDDQTNCDNSEEACTCPVKYGCTDAPNFTCEECQPTWNGSECTYDSSCTYDTELACQTSCIDTSDPECWECTSETAGQDCSQTCAAVDGVCPTGCYDTAKLCRDSIIDDKCYVKPCYKCRNNKCVEVNKFKQCKGGPADGAYDTLAECEQETGCLGGGGSGESPPPLDPPVPEQALGNSFGFSTDQLKEIYGINSIGFFKQNTNILTSMRNIFMPVKRQNIRPDLFKNEIHGPIKAVILMNKGSMPYSDAPFGSISEKHLERSLNENLVILMKSCRAADGRPIYRRLLNTIRDYILDGKIEEFNVPRFTETLNRIIEAQRSGDYDDTRKEFSFNKVAKPQEALDLVLRKGKPYSHKNYGQRVGERMRLWKTVATDLFKNIPFVKSDGSTTKIPIKKDDSFKFIKDDETEVSGYINDGDFVNFVNDEGQTIRVEVDGEHERAGVISLEVMEKALNLLNDDLEYSLTVETDVSARVEEQYNYNDAHRTAYVLKLKPETILDLPRKNQFVARTSAEYLFETGRKKHTEWLKYKPFPYLVIHVDHEDPIISFFQYATKITFNTKDFTLDTVDNGTMPLYPRRLPWTIIVIPTDRSDLNIYGGKSRYTGYGTRVLSIRMHPDPSRTRTGLDGPHLKTSFASDQRGVAPTRDPQALEYSYDLDKLRDLRRYEVKDDNTELLPRRKGAVRTVLETLRDFNEYYKISDTSRLTWEEVYEKMPNTNLKKLYRECLDWMNVKTKLTMGSVSDNEDIDTLYARPLDQLSNKATAAQQRIFSRFEVGVRINLEKIDDPADIPDGPELPEAPDD